MRTPSWRISVFFPEMLPGVVPPTSPQWARTTGWMTGSAPWNRGAIIATSFRCVPPV